MYWQRKEQHHICVTVKNQKYLMLLSIAILQRNGQVVTTTASVAGFLKYHGVLLSTQHKKSVTCNVRITETEQLVWPAKDSMLQLQRNVKNGLCGLTIIVSRIMTMQTVGSITLYRPTLYL